MADQIDSAEAVARYLSKRQPAETLRASMSLAVGANPDQEAEFRRLSAQSGVPVDAVRSFPKDVKQQATLQALDFDAIAQDFPRTASFLSGIDNARIAHDDIQNMGAIEAMVNSFKRGVPALRQNVAAMGFRANAGILADVAAVEAKIAAGQPVLDSEDPYAIRFMSPAQRQEFKAKAMGAAGAGAATIAAMQAQKYAIPQPPVVASVMQAKEFGEALKAFMTDPVTFIASIGPESLVQSAPSILAAIPAGVVAGPAAAAAVLGGWSFAVDYPATLLEALGKEGVDIRDSAALKAAAADIPLMRRVAAQAIAHASVVGAVDAASAGPASKIALPKALVTKMAGRPVVRELANMAVQTPAQGLMGGVGEAGGQLAAGQPLDPGNILAEIVGEAFSAPAEVAGMAVTQGRERFKAAQQANDAAARAEQLTKLADASKLLGRDAETFRQYVQQVADEGGDTPAQFYVDAEVLTRSLNQSGITREELAAVAPVVAAQIEVATPGGQVRVPVSEFLAAGERVTAPLVDHLRESPEAMTRAEAKHFIDQQGESIRADVERELQRRDDSAAFRQSIADVQAQFQGELDAAKRFTPDVNKAYASLLANFYGAQAARLGITPQELLQRYGLRIQARAGAGGAVLDQRRAAQAVPTGRISPITRKPMIEVRDAAGNVLGTTHSFATPEEALQSFNAPKAPAPAPTYTVPEALPGTNWDQVSGQFSNTDQNDEFLYHVTSTDRADAVLSDGLRPNAGGMFGGAYANHSAGKVFLTERAGVSYWQEKVEQQLFDQMEDPPEVVVLRIPKAAITAQLTPDEAGTQDARAAAFYATETLWQGGLRVSDATTTAQAENPEAAAPARGAGDAQATAGATDAGRSAGVEAAGLTQAAGTLNADSATGPRAQITFARDITLAPSVITLLDGADLSSFIHEAGHLFLEVQSDLAIRIQQQIASGAGATDLERGLVDDMNRLLAWFGIKGDENLSALDTWAMMSLEQRRFYHEQFARGFEAFAFEGKAPSIALQAIFSRFRSWLVQVYQTLRGLDVTLTDDVRQVMGRMLATDEAIAEAEAQHSMGPLFKTAETAGMTLDEFNAYQALAQRSTDAAAQDLQARSLKDMRWLHGAVDKALKARQKEVEGLRREVRAAVRLEVLGEPIYRAWQALTGKAPKSLDADPAAVADQQARQEWTQRRAEAEAAATQAERDALYAANPDSKGIQKGQLLAKNRRQIDISVQQRMLEWDKANPKPAAAAQILEEVEPGLIGKLDADEVALLNPAAAATLAARKMTAKEGAFPDAVAEVFGFESGDAMVRALAEAVPPNEAIEARTDQRLLELYGDITSPEAIKAAADEAVHNEARARFIATELKALQAANKVRDEGKNSLYGRSTVDAVASAAKGYVQQIIARLKVGEIRPAQYAAAEARSARLAEKALAAGNLEEAAMHKRNQLINNYAAKAAQEALADIAKAREFFRKVNTGNAESIAKTRDVAIVNVARAILAEYGVGTKGKSAQEYLAAVEANDPDLFTVLGERVQVMTAAAQPIKEMSVENLRGLHDEIRNLWQMAKRSKQIEIDGKLVDKATATMALRATLDGIGVPPRIPGEGKAVTDGERRLSMLQSAWAALRRVESWVQQKDGGDTGAFRRYVWQPVRDAADAYRVDKAKYLKQYRALLEGLDLGRGRIDAPELGYVFGFSRGGSGKQELLHAILHTGNESNKRKLLLGRKWATESADGVLDTSNWDAFIRRMIDQGVIGKAEYDFAQGVWDLLESTKPLAQKAHRDVFGRYFDEVTADAFTTPFGSYRGGYVPALADSEVVSDAKTRAFAEAENQSLAFAFPSTSKGFTKSRAEYNRQLLLDLRSLAQHIDKVLLFSHLEQPIRDVRKVLTDKEVAEPLSRIDPTAFDGLLTPWLNRAARQSVETPVPGSNGLMRFFSKARSRAGLAAMFANLSNTLQQITGLSIAAVKVKPKYLLPAAAQWLHSPKQTARAVAEASPYMATRMDNEVAQMTDAINDILLNPSVYERAQSWTAKHAYFMQSAVDNCIGVIVWQGAYNQALEAGASERDAVRQADSAVRQTQGSTLPEDVARFESGNSFVRLFTQFAGYFNMQANLLGTEFANGMHQLGLRRGMGRGLYVFMFGFLAPVLVSELIVQAFRGGPDDEDKDGEYLDDWLAALGLGTLRGAIAMVPVAGQITNAMINTMNSKPYDDRISTSPAISMIESAVRAPVSAYRAIVDDGSVKKAVRDVATLITLTTGLPATAVARPVGYLADMAQDRVQPTGAVDTARGLVTGVASPDSKR